MTRSMRGHEVLKVRNVRRRFGFSPTEHRDVRVVLRNIPGTLEQRGGETRFVADPAILAALIKQFAEPASEAVSRATLPQGLDFPTVWLDFGGSDTASARQDPPPVGNEVEIKFGVHPVEQPRWSLDAVILPRTTSDQLRGVLELMNSHDLIFRVWNLASVMRSTKSAITLNFYGPSGTGKTLCAEAVAHHLDRPIMRVSYADLESKYVGEMNKNIRAVFAQATATGSVLFFDEADSILGRRLSSVSQAADHGVNMARSVMLIELERFEGVVIFASNLIENYDRAFMRRLLHHVAFDLPDLEARRKIFSMHLPSELPLAPEVTLDILSTETDGFSGGDIRNVVLRGAALAAAAGLGGTRVVELTHLRAAVAETRHAQAAASGGTAANWMRDRVQRLAPDPSAT